MATHLSSRLVASNFQVSDYSLNNPVLPLNQDSCEGQNKE